MSRIIVAFDYFSPQYPLLNNQDFNRPLSELEVDNGTYEFFGKISGYECHPSVILKDQDYFIYPIRLGLHPDEWLNHPEIDILATTNMSLHTFNALRGRNGFIFFDLGNEAALNDSILDPIHDYCKRKEIPLKKVILQTGNVRGEEIYQDYCYRKQLSNGGLRIATYEYFEWMTSRLMSQHRNANLPILPINTDYSKVKKTFLCLNRVHRWHRVNLYVLFNAYNLLDHSYYTMDNKSHMEAETINLEDAWRTIVDKNIFNKLKLTDKFVDDIYNKLPLKIDEFGAPDVMAELYNSSVDPCYNNSLISVVTETNFDNNEVFLTEKIFKPILHRHPFILVGAYKSLAHLHSLGYKTFNEFFDESYDDIEDPVERLLAIGELCKEIQSWDDAKKRSFFFKSMPITTHNYELLSSLYPDNMRRNFWHKMRDFAVFEKHKLK